MAWRLAKSLQTLRAQLDERWPGRDRTSDGSIGDAAHASRDSDHNPWVDGGVVTALDVDRDIAPGVTSRLLAESLVASRDPRIKYIISNAQIISGSDIGHTPWVWRPYSGPNAHKEHMHLSVEPTKCLYDNTGPWRIDLQPSEVVVPKAPIQRDILRLGSAGTDVMYLQTRLGGLKVDGDFGPKTRDRVVEYQKEKGLKPDGIVGYITWTAIERSQ